MENLGDTPSRRRRRGAFGLSATDSTDGISSGFTEPDTDLADTIVDINRLVEQKSSADDTESATIDVYDRETRLRKIHKLRMRDTPKAEMCKKLGITMGQLEKDISELFSRLSEGARSFDINVCIGDTIAHYNEVLSMALNHASNRRIPVPTRLAALRTVLSAKNDMVRFLNAAGVFDAAVYKQKEGRAETDIGALIKTTQALLDRDEVSDTHKITPVQRQQVEADLAEIRLF